MKIRHLYHRAALLLLLAAAACTGTQARETVLMPAMAQAWETSIGDHVERGIVAGETAATITPAEAAELRRQADATLAALKSGDRFALIGTGWAALRMAAIGGIQARVAAGEIGPGVARTHMETVRQYDERQTQLLLR